MGIDRESERAAADDRDEAYADYYADINDGCGCAELWEYMSERRRQ